jgi:hypothetical protein
MTANPLAKHYEKLTAEERFSLIYNAGVRGDDAEQVRLASSAPRLVLSFPHTAPYVEAFTEITFTVLLELLDLAAGYDEAWLRADDAAEFALRDRTRGKAKREQPSDRYLDLALAQGYFLKTKAAGWELWCERRHLPAFAVWQLMPGYDRLRRAIELTRESAHSPNGLAFTSAGMLRWLNRIARERGEPEQTELPFSANGIADGLETFFQARVRFHAGDDA